MRNSRCKQTLAVLPAAAIAILATGCAKHDPQSRSTATASPPSVAAVRITRTNLTGTITLTGEFIPFQEVDVMSKVAGYIRNIRVDVGHRVHKGDVLATLEVPEMNDEVTRAAASIEQANAEAARAEAELQRAQSAHEIAHLSLDRIQKAAAREPGLLPQQEVDEVRSRDVEAEAQVAAAKGSLAATRQRIHVMQADDARIKTMRAYETITAPIDGVITKRFANTGSMIQAGTASQTQAMPVVSVSENGLLRLVLPVPESAVAHVAIGRSVNVRVPSLGRTFTGRVARFTNKLQLSTRTMDTEVDVPNPSFSIMPGMHAEVDLELQSRTGVLATVPDAIDGVGLNTRVFLINPEGILHIIPVQTGLETAQEVEIRSGVNEGDLVVAGRRTGLKEGDKVKPVAASFTNAELRK